MIFLFVYVNDWNSIFLTQDAFLLFLSNFLIFSKGHLHSNYTPNNQISLKWICPPLHFTLWLILEKFFRFLNFFHFSLGLSFKNDFHRFKVIFRSGFLLTEICKPSYHFLCFYIQYIILNNFDVNPTFDII